VVSFPQVFPPKSCRRLSPSPYAPHAPPISFFLTLSLAQYWVSSTDNKQYNIRINNRIYMLSQSLLYMPVTTWRCWFFTVRSFKISALCLHVKHSGPFRAHNWILNLQAILKFAILLKWPLYIQFRIACAAVRRHFRASKNPRVFTAVTRANYWTLFWGSWIHTYFHTYFWRLSLMLFCHLRSGLFVFEFSV
jgi:hypothetical protein